MQLTDRQREVYQFIKTHIGERGYPPTTREIGNAVGISSPNGVLSHLKALRKKGFIDWDDFKSRSIRLLKVLSAFEFRRNVNLDNFYRDLPGEMHSFEDFFQEENSQVLAEDGRYVVYSHGGNRLVGTIRRIT